MTENNAPILMVKAKMGETEYDLALRPFDAMSIQNLNGEPVIIMHDKFGPCGYLQMEKDAIKEFAASLAAQALDEKPALAEVPALTSEGLPEE